MPDPPDEAKEYQLAPDEPLPEVKPSFPLPASGSDEPPVDREQDQFSLSELLGLTAVMATFLSVITSVGRWTGNSPLQLATTCAGILGVVALVSMIVLSFIPQTRRIVKVGWWVLLTLYIVAAAAAVLMSK